MDVTGDEMAKTHSRYLAGGRPGDLPGERIIRFEFPERPGALADFLERLDVGWYLVRSVRARLEAFAARPRCAGAGAGPLARLARLSLRFAKF